MICFKDGHASIEYQPSEQVICCRWEGEVDSEAFQQTMQLNLHYMRQLLTRGWVADMRRMDAIGYDDQQWLLENWLPQIFSLPLQKVAIIQSDNSYNSMVIEDMVRYAPGKPSFTVQLFADYEASLDWIQDPAGGNLGIESAGAGNAPSIP